MSDMKMQQTWDAVVIGAGPAGSSTAATLAAKGRRVAILEKEGFPRYRVGESLIPYCWYPLERLGVVDKLAASDFVVVKNSVQFVNLEGVRAKPYYFFQHRDHPSSKTWQVVRSKFDSMLLENALEKGAQLFSPMTARELLWDGGTVAGVRADDADGESHVFHARVTVDASGRDTFAQNQNRWRVADQKLKKFAIWTYYKGALRDEGLDEGATTVAYLPNKGWFWYIPLADDMVSVGVVADGEYLYGDSRELEQIFLREVAKQPWIREHLEPGTCTGEFRSTSDFTYRSRHCAADGLVLTGDAFSFLDPVFSSGVFLALQGGVLAGDAIDEALEQGDLSAARFRAYGERVCQGIESMRQLVHAFYDLAFSFGDFLKEHPDRRADITDCLIGDLFRDFGPLFEAVSDFAEIPEPLPHGEPLGLSPSQRAHLPPTGSLD